MPETKYKINLSVAQVSVFVSIPKDHATKLRYLAEIDNVSMQDVINEAVKQYLDSRSLDFSDWTSINIVQPLREQIGNNLASIRQIFGASQKELAAVIGVGQKSISSIENGKAGISLAAILKICNFLGCSLQEVITGVPGGKVPKMLSNEEIGNKLKKFRINSQMSQTELGVKIRCSQAIISLIESGERPLAVCEYVILGNFLEE